jgi:hypothetical protein
MKLEDIKIGETYYVRVKVKTKGEDYIRVTPILQGGVLSTYWPTSFVLGESSAFSPIPPENGRNNSEPAPKYDPNRLFKKGDKVRYVKRNGRFCPGSHAFEEQMALLGTVVKDEQRDYFVVVNFENDVDNYLLDPAYLELVTPVEELEPYYVEQSTHKTYWEVWRRDSKDGDTRVVTYKNDYHPNAKAAAEAERDRLNAEYRKEQTEK